MLALCLAPDFVVVHADVLLSGVLAVGVLSGKSVRYTGCS